MSSVILNLQDCSFSLSIAASVKLVSLCVLVIRVFSFNDQLVCIGGKGIQF